MKACSLRPAPGTSLRGCLGDLGDPWGMLGGSVQESALQIQPDRLSRAMPTCSRWSAGGVLLARRAIGRGQDTATVGPVGCRAEASLLAVFGHINVHAIYSIATETQTATLQRLCSERCTGFVPCFLNCTFDSTGMDSSQPGTTADPGWPKEAWP